MAPLPPTANFLCCEEANSPCICGTHPCKRSFAAHPCTPPATCIPLHTPAYPCKPSAAACIPMHTLHIPAAMLTSLPHLWTLALPSIILPSEGKPLRLTTHRKQTSLRCNSCNVTQTNIKYVHFNCQQSKVSHSESALSNSLCELKDWSAIDIN